MLLCELDVMEYAVTMEEALIEELNDFDDFYEEVLDRYDECGFNPYMGCYDFDCQSKFFIVRIPLHRTYVRVARADDPGAIVKNLTRLFRYKNIKRG